MNKSKKSKILKKVVKKNSLPKGSKLASAQGYRELDPTVGAGMPPGFMTPMAPPPAY